MTTQKESKFIFKGGVITLTEIANYYGVSNKTMRKRVQTAEIPLLKKIRKRNYTPGEVRRILEELGDN